MRQFNTLTGFLLSKSSNPSINDIVEFSGYDSTGDGGGAQWKHNGVTGQTVSQAPLLNAGKLTDGNGNEWEIVSGGTVPLSAFGGLTQAYATAALTYCVPNNIPIDFSKANIDITLLMPSIASSLQVGVDYAYLCKTATGRVLDIMIDEGHAPLSGVSVENGSYAHIKISSIDSVVTLAATFDTAADFIAGDNSAMPTLNCLIDANGKCRTGYFANNTSSGVVSDNCGVKTAGRYGLFANAASNVSAPNGVFTECSQESAAYAGILAWASTIYALNADVSNSLYYGAQAAAGGALHFRGGKADNCVRHGIRATKAATVNANNASAQSCGVSGIRSFDGGLVFAADVNVTGSNVGLWCEDGSTISAPRAIGSNTTSNFIFCNSGSLVEAGSSTALLINSSAVVALNGSKVTIASSTISTVNGSIINTDNSEVVANSCAFASSGTTVCIDAQNAARVNINAATCNTPNAAFATVSDGSELKFKDGVATYTGTSGLNCSNGSICNLNGSNVPSSDVAGMLFNTLYSRGIVFG